MKYSVLPAICFVFIFASCEKKVDMNFSTSPLSVSDSILIFGTTSDTTVVDSTQIRNTSDPTYSYDNNPSSILRTTSMSVDSLSHISPDLKPTSPVVVTDDYANAEPEKPIKRSTANVKSDSKTTTPFEQRQRPAETTAPREVHTGVSIKPIEIPQDIASCKNLLSQQERLFQNERNPERKEQIRQNIISLTDKIRYEAKWKGDDETYNEAKNTYEKYK